MSDQKITIYRMTIGKQLDGSLGFSEIHEAEMTEKSVNMFRWDRINRLDVLENDTVVLLSNDVTILKSCSDGMGILLDLQKNWDNIFNKKNIKQLQKTINKHVEKETSSE